LIFYSIIQVSTSDALGTHVCVNDMPGSLRGISGAGSQTRDLLIASPAS